MENLSVAVYSANFGNYRNEMKNGIDVLTFDKNIDYYFFTDNTTIKSKNWKIFNFPLLNKFFFMNPSRNSAKFVKFMVPLVLRKYDIIIWSDSKNLTNLSLSKEKIIKLFSENKKDIFLIKHPRTKTPQQEIINTCRLNLENKKTAYYFLRNISRIKFKIPLPDTKCFMYRNNFNTISTLQKVYFSLMYNRLVRDQNVINYVLRKNNYESKILYFNLKNICM